MIVIIEPSIVRNTVIQLTRDIIWNELLPRFPSFSCLRDLGHFGIEMAARVYKLGSFLSR